MKVKICGLKTEEAVKTAIENGADFLGFVFYPPSPRNISPEDAVKISGNINAKKVAVVVNPSDILLDEIVKHLKPQFIQFHGNESESRVREIKEKYGIGIIRSVEPDFNPKELDNQLYDYILVDAPKGALPGGNGIPFDWENFTPPQNEWFLSGGLTPENVFEAVQITGTTMVDVSSGVESAPGVKDIEKIKKFLQIKARK